jgi:uncharacterized repeat protein (TIGR03803 family)
VIIHLTNGIEMTVLKSFISQSSYVAALVAFGWFMAGTASAQPAGSPPTKTKLTTLYTFSGADGNYPEAGLVQATNGDLYGTTFYGGAYSSGTVFKITPSGSLTTLYSFCALTNCADGKWPVAGLVQATNGDLYGTTVEGGASNFGTIFKITPGGSLTTLYDFCLQATCPDGRYPFYGLVQAANGDLYGTASLGNPSQPIQGGAVFKITPSGVFTTVYTFCAQAGCPDGMAPQGALVQGTNGDFYGTTTSGGANPGVTLNGGGTVFKITPTGVLTTLHSFCAENGCTDGYFPYAGLVQATNGNLYGTTENGGTSGDGTIFEITPGGSFTTMYSFCAETNCADGFFPLASLLQDTNGSLYGTTVVTGANGNFGDGTVFKLSVGLGPFAETQPTAGIVGEAVKILGSSLTGATSVTFNGIPATFTVVSPCEVSTSVPASATTGKIKVVTPGGALLSNIVFEVLP